MDHVVGIELDALEDEVVQYVEGKERREQEDARVGVLAEAFVVVGSPRQGVERQHRAADDVEIHLHVEALVEERQFLDTPEPQRQDRISYLALRLAEHRQERKDGGNDRSARHRMNRGPVEPLP